MSGQIENEGSSAEFICRIPSLPDLERSFSLEHTARQRKRVAVIPDFNSFVESDSTPMLRQKRDSNLPYMETNMMESIGKPSESHNSSQNNRLFIHNPRDFEGHECTPKMLWDAPKRREVIAQRPTPIYPRSAREAGTKSRRHSYYETPSRASSVECTSTPCEVTPFVNSTTDSPSAFQIQSSLFIPIRETESDFLATEPLMPRTRLDSITPPPRLKLRPRGNQMGLTLRPRGNQVGLTMRPGGNQVGLLSMDQFGFS